MKALVTGGGGFLGKAIVRRLVDRGDGVRRLARGEYPELAEWGVETVRGDIADYRTVAQAADGCDVVFHVAANAGVWGPYKAYFRPNVLGTENVIEACRQREVPRLVFTSSPSVVFNGRDQEGCDESEPYPKNYLAHYPQTKAIAEQMVMAANGHGLRTVSLRPHLIWGPDDTHLAPRIIERAKAGRLRIVGTGEQMIDAVYIDNAADAHVLAADRLTEGAACCGNTYFITNDEPLAFDHILNGILEAAGLPPVTKRVSPRAAYAAGALLELAFALLRKKEEPMMTRFVARQLTTAHWYTIDAAKADLGYAPRVSMVEGMRKLAASFQADAAETPEQEGGESS